LLGFFAPQSLSSPSGRGARTVQNRHANDPGGYHGQGGAVAQIGM